MNTVTLIGDLATDVALRAIGDERKVADFLLSVPRPEKAGGADVVRVTAWNRLGETCAAQLVRGRRVAVDGRLRSRSWTDADGKRRSAVDVVAATVQFLSPGASAADAGKEAPLEEPALS